MIEERYIELMSAEIDGLNSTADSAALQKYLESDPEARRYFTELEQSTRLLAESEYVTAPADSVQRIMARIAEREEGGHAPRTGRAVAERARRRRFGSLLRPALAWAFAAGLALGLLAFATGDVLRRGAPTTERLRGDLSWPARIGEELRGSPWRVDGPGFHGVIRTTVIRGAAGGFSVQVTGEAEPGVRFVFSHEGRVAGAAFRTVTGPAATLTIEPDRAVFTFTGAGDYVIKLATDVTRTATLTLAIESTAKRQERIFGPGPP